MDNTLNTRVYQDDFRSWVGIRLFRYIDNHNIETVTSLGFQEISLRDGIFPPETPIKLPLESAQTLMDQLWQVGLRPTEGTGSAGSLKATQDHLKEISSINTRLLTMLEKLFGGKILL